MVRSTSRPPRYLTMTLLYMHTHMQTHTHTHMQGTFAVQHTAESSKVLIWPPYEDMPMHIALHQGEITAIKVHEKDADLVDLTSIVIYPARHHVTSEDELKRACRDIEIELDQRLTQLESEGNSVAAQRCVCVFT